MPHQRLIYNLVVSYLAIASFLVVVFISLTSTTTQTRKEVSIKPPYLPTVEELDKICTHMEKVSRGKYPGTNRTRPGKRGPIPIWSQRTSILYYNRRIVGDPIKWLALAMGVVGNSKNIISNKKIMRSAWKNANPSMFSNVEAYLPQTWSDIDSFESDMEGEVTYVYKPVLGFGGEGILFKNAREMSRYIREKESSGDRSGWVVQEFIDPYLFHKKKTHMRIITLIIIQPDGTRNFYMYDKMRIFTAAEDFDRSRLLEGGDTSFMLLTNLHQNKIHFENDPANADKEFIPSHCIYDAEETMKNATGTLSFSSIFSSTKTMHSIIYSIIGDIIECVPTDVSIYDDACFHIMASDVAVDRNGRPYFLEMNNAMGYKAWSNKEITELSHGVASLVKGTSSPYLAGDSSMWHAL